MQKYFTAFVLTLCSLLFQVHAQKDSTVYLEKIPHASEMPPPPPDSRHSSVRREGKRSCEENYAEVWDLYQSEDYKKSLTLIDKVLKSCDQQSAYYEMKAYILIKLDRKKEIIETTTKGLAISPQNASLYEMRGNTYYFDFQPEKALSDFREMFKYDKKNGRYYNNYLKLLNEMRKDTEMISVFSAFLKEDTKANDFKEKEIIPEIYFYSSLAYQRQKNTKKAVELLDQALKLSPDAEPYLNNRALFLQELGQSEKALADMNRSIELNPKVAQSYIHRANLYQEKKEFENSRKDYLKALALGSGDNGIYADLANVYLQLNDYTKARQNFEIFLTKNKESPSAYSNYAYALFDMKDYKKSLENFEKAYALENNEIDTLVGMAVLYKLNGNEKRSEEMKKEIAAKTEYKAEKKLLKTLENSHYFYTDKFKKEWENLF
ncbi:tetratricopeptide repeat protein [Kaistella jeonii]|uniref:Uncharacterized protein n=1 Tax=Kaistella jeonii TaxID=266749 RepID=A0A0C1FEE2_9FLAO|nr:tetratricopeptide repeat protein [Kaistella jeonii]KIA90158.1 hypothetical protein OA86_06110 [Kaistella jeonii]SFB76957.1 Tetratricopeptide repeat-containing protein [Kaistella jeonii]VEI96443.1 photosystem I assembly protein Ycf3 [Kaistella jeonii]